MIRRSRACKGEEGSGRFRHNRSEQRDVEANTVSSKARTHKAKLYWKPVQPPYNSGGVMRGDHHFWAQAHPSRSSGPVVWRFPTTGRRRTFYIALDPILSIFPNTARIWTAPISTTFNRTIHRTSPHFHLSAARCKWHLVIHRLAFFLLLQLHSVLLNIQHKEGAALFICRRLLSFPIPHS